MGDGIGAGDGTGPARAGGAAAPTTAAALSAPAATAVAALGPGHPRGPEVGHRRVPRAEVRRRIGQITLYACGHALALAGVGAGTAHLSRRGLAVSVGTLAGVGGIAPMAGLLAGRLLPPSWVLARHLALAALDLGVGLTLSLATAGGGAVLPFAGCCLGAAVLCLGTVAAVAPREFGSGEAATAVEESALIGLSLLPAVLSLTPAGRLARALRTATGVLGAGFVCLMFIDRSRRLADEVTGDDAFDALRASLSLYPPLLALMFHFCHAGSALPLRRLRLSR